MRSTMIFKFFILSLFSIFPYKNNAFSDLIKIETNQFNQKKQKKETFHLKDFEGKWVLQGHSVGGVDGTSGDSYVAIGNVKFNRKGEGYVHHSRLSIYSGPIGTPITVLENPDRHPATIILQDRKNGRGIVILKRAISPQDQLFSGEFFFVARKNKDKVVDMYIQSKKASEEDGSVLGAVGIGVYHLKRQYR